MLTLEDNIKYKQFIAETLKPHFTKLITVTNYKNPRQLCSQPIGSQHFISLCNDNCHLSLNCSEEAWIEEEVKIQRGASMARERV